MDYYNYVGCNKVRICAENNHKLNWFFFLGQRKFQNHNQDIFMNSNVLFIYISGII